MDCCRGAHLALFPVLIHPVTYTCSNDGAGQRDEHATPFAMICAISISHGPRHHRILTTCITILYKFPHIDAVRFKILTAACCCQALQLFVTFVLACSWECMTVCLVYGVLRILPCTIHQSDVHTCIPVKASEENNFSESLAPN